MSEAEKKQRLEYKKNRKKWIMIQAICIAVVAVLVLGFAFAYYQINKTYYIEYTENSSVDYSVQLAPNDFYEQEWIGKDQAYVTSLIENVMAKFRYELEMDAPSGIEYSYSYRIDATLLITDKYSGTVIYQPVTELVPTQTHTQSGGQKLEIRETVLLDYDEFNDKAILFNKTYGLKDSNCLLVVTMHVNVSGACDEFASDSENTYYTSLNFPLAVDTAEPAVTASITQGEVKELACSSAINQKVFLVLAIVLGVLDLIAAAVLVGFTYLTRNEDINYTIKVQRLFKNYRSFIQQITNDFDTEGYQILFIKTFNEMLGIRDTIQSPILMCENADQTKTQFMIPTNTKILYVFEIKVDNYDALYGEPEQEEIVEEPIEEPIEEPVEEIEEEEEVVLVDESVPEEEVSEALAEPDIELEEISYVEDNDEELDEGVEVIGVVWPEKAKNNKVYRYDPNGEQLEKGDLVLVPTRDVHKNREVIRKAAVAHENHKIDPALHPYTIKKIIGVIKRHAENALTSKSEES